MALEVARQAAGDPASHPEDLGGVGRWQVDETQRARGVGLVDPVQHENVEMNVESERVAEPLHERHGAALRPPELGPAAGATPVGGEDGA